MYTPIICEEPDSSARAVWEGRKLSCWMALCTRRAVAGATEPLPLTTREAVPRPTPARRATSLMVAMRRVQSGARYASLARWVVTIPTPRWILARIGSRLARHAQSLREGYPWVVYPHSHLRDTV